MTTAVGWSTGCGTTRIDNLGEAMSPTLRNGEKVSATRRFDEVNRGDIVVFRYPKDEARSFVKRVVGLPHERIASAAGKVSINGQIISEPYVVAENQSNDSWGVALGAALGNVGLGVAFGLVGGAAIGAVISRRSKTPVDSVDLRRS